MKKILLRTGSLCMLLNFSAVAGASNAHLPRIWRTLGTTVVNEDPPPPAPEPPSHAAAGRAGSMNPPGAVEDPPPPDK
ncbi:MAG TPA: hypothetical protein VI298_05865 [Geobacteraceae bacterium]